MKKKIAIIYTMFKRDELAKKTLMSIANNWRDEFFLLIGDQDPHSDKAKLEWIKDILEPGANAWEYYALPFDYGLSSSRNTLVQAAGIKGLPFCLVTADSLGFLGATRMRVTDAMTFLEKNEDKDLLGFDIDGRIPWEFYMDLKDGHFVLRETLDFEQDVDSALGYYDCDICRNFFIATTKSLLDVKWDEQLKLAEHEDFFWRYKQAGYGVAWTPDISGFYIEDRPKEYQEYRKRCYTEFRALLKKKYNLKGWVKYEPARPAEA